MSEVETTAIVKDIHLIHIKGDVPVFHNMCGRRTTDKPCGCTHCCDLNYRAMLTTFKDQGEAK